MFDTITVMLSVFYWKKLLFEVKTNYKKGNNRKHKEISSSLDKSIALNLRPKKRVKS